MADFVPSIFVIALPFSYSALLIGLLVWMLHGWLGERIKKRTSQNATTRYRFLRLLHRN